MAKPKYPIQTEAEVQGLGKIVYVNAPFDKGLSALKRKGINQISARDLAYARIELKDENHSVSQNGSYVKDGVLYTQNPEHRRVLTRNSLVSRHPKKSTNAHRNGVEDFISKKEADEIIERAHSNDNSVLILKDLSAVPTDKFGEDKRTIWLFGDKAQLYGDFLRNSKYNIQVMPLSFDNDEYIDKQGKPYDNQLWFHGLDDDSLLYGVSRLLDFDSRVRVVQKIAKGNEKNIKAEKPKIEVYTPKEISKALKGLKLSGLEETILTALKKE